MLVDFSVLDTTDDLIARIGLLLDSKLVVVMDKVFSLLDLAAGDEAAINSLANLALVNVADALEACSLLDAVLEGVIDGTAVTLWLDIVPVDTKDAIEISSILATAFDDEKVNLLLNSVLVDVAYGMIGVTIDEMSNLLLDAALVGVINGMGICSLLDVVLLEETDDIDATELAAVVNAMPPDVLGVAEASSELYKCGTELTDVLMDVAVVCTS